jgi:OPA family glycerol-3-phosphate transporter-like MFS transporter
MAAFLFSAPQIAGWAAVFITMASIGITSLMSGTAATDFGGRKATATSMGIVNGFAYIGSGIQSLSLGFLLPPKGPSWHWLPVFVIPFAVIGTFIAIKIWHELPAATRKYIAEVEQKMA